MTNSNFYFYILIFTLIFIFYIFKEYFYNYKISIVIPCIPRDIQYLDRLLMSINEQTYKPYETIIAMSGLSFSNSNALELRLQDTYSFPIKIYNNVHKQYASENRNRGALKSTGDIITFMDADDKMYPKKLEYVNKYFNIYNPKIFIHSLSKGYDNYITKENPEILLGDVLYDKALKSDGSVNNLLNEGSLGIICTNEHNGHVSIPREVIEKVKYREGSKYKRGQDCIFIRDILNMYGRNKKTALFVDIPLSQYIESAKQNSKF